MVSIVGVDVGIQGTGDDEQRYRFTSDRRISSILSEISERPLCPEPAAMRPTYQPSDATECQTTGPTSSKLVIRLAATARPRVAGRTISPARPFATPYRASMIRPPASWPRS